MGKSTTAAMFRMLGVPVHDSDAQVRRFYAGEGVAAIGAQFPGAIVGGKVDRGRLSEIVVADPQKLKVLESLVHPAIRAHRARFVTEAAASGQRLLVLDIPLLFETGCEGEVDVIVTVSAGEDVQRERVLSRPGMSAEKFALIKSKQLDDRAKRARSHCIIETGHGLESARRQVEALIRALS